MARDKTIYYNAPADLYVKALLDGADQSFEDILNVAIANKAKEGKSFQEIQDALAFSGGSESSINYGNEIIKRYRGTAYFGCEKDKYWDFRNNEKSEEQRILLIAFLALKSIIGKDRAYCHVTNEYWLSRMCGHSGFAPEKEIPDKTEEAERKVKRKTKGGKYEYVIEKYTRAVSKKKVRVYHPTIEKYSSHYKLQKIKALLYEYYHVSTYSNTRGFYASCEMKLTDLITTVIERREDRSKVSSLASDTKKIEEQIMKKRKQQV